MLVITVVMVWTLMACQIFAQYTWDCRRINVCKNVVLRDETSYFGLPRRNDRLGDTEKNSHNVRPLGYALRLEFKERTHYEGKVDITLSLTNNTDRIPVNLCTDCVQYDNSSITIEPICDESARQRETPEGEPNCIRYLIDAKKSRVLWMETNRPLTFRLKYILSFPRFWSRSYNPTDGNGSPGLVDNRIGDTFSVTYTNFRPYGASTVFPCFDNPAFKTPFRLTIAHDRSLLVASVTYAVMTRADTPMFEVDFATTASISTYNFGFAIVTDQLTRIVKDTGSTVRILCPDTMKEREEELLALVIFSINHMSTFTSHAFSFKQLDLIVVASSKAIETETAGLVIVGMDLIDGFYQLTDRSYDALFRSIARQWIGSMVSVDHWGAASLQDGLAEYFGWRLQRMFRNFPDEILKSRSVLKRQSYEPHSGCILQDYVYDPNITMSVKCMMRGASIYRAIGAELGPDQVNSFLFNLLNQYQWTSVGIDKWNMILTWSSSLTNQLPTYLKTWFEGSGPVTLTIAREGQALTISQSTAGLQLFKYPLLFSVYTSDSGFPMHVITEDHQYMVLLSDERQWALVDPNDDTPLYKVYDNGLYLDIFTALVSHKASPYHTAWAVKFTLGFCDTLERNILPLFDDYDETIWKEIFQLASSVHPQCRCCLKPSTTRSCSTDQEARHCDSLKLVKALRYDAR